MSDTPKRIWAESAEPMDAGGVWVPWPIDAAEYIRRDAPELVALVEALKLIGDEASVPVHTWKNGINFKKMYVGWRKIATERIDIARTALEAYEALK